MEAELAGWEVCDGGFEEPAGVVLWEMDEVGVAEPEELAALSLALHERGRFKLRVCCASAEDRHERTSAIVKRVSVK